MTNWSKHYPTEFMYIICCMVLHLRTLLVTFLQPTYARYVFPCFDEPALKATFETTLVIPDNEGYQAVSNGIEKVCKKEVNRVF